MPTPNFLAAFAAQARTRPDASALTWADADITYDRLDRAARAAQVALTALGLPADAPLCVPAVKSPATIALLIACFRAGRSVLLPSPTLGAAALDRLCAQAGCSHRLRADGTDVVAQAVDAVPGRRPGPGLMLTTSGSTGTPKIVVLSDAGIDAFLDWVPREFAIGPGDRVLNYAPLNFDLCLFDVWTALALGARVDLVDPEWATDRAHLADLCTRRATTVIQAVPLLLRLVTEAGAILPSVRHVLLTGDVTPVALLDRIRAACPHATLWNLYGCTETNDSFLYEIDVERARAAGGVPIGAPIAGVETRVVDADGYDAAEGELVVRTPFRARGYLDPDLDRERWHNGWFRTGDLVRRDAAGEHVLTGRNDHQVKVRGVRTNLAEVEQVILDHPEVVEAAVVALADEQAGHVLYAAVRRIPGSRMSGLQLRIHCAAALPRTAIPGDFDIGDAALPRTSTGKVDRHALLRLKERT
jgi:acyl-coenzyme A synthetase/AMP-(fatty) acid ligase